MFKQLLEGIFEQKNLTTEQEQIAYLCSLRPVGKSLWDSYRTQNVNVDYTSVDTQNAYLLRYFPSYAKLVPYVLGESDVQLPKVELLQPIFFGCGPAPEFVGLLEHLKENCPDTGMVSATFVDIAIDTWRHSINISIDRVVSRIWDAELCDYQYKQVDIADADLLQKIKVGDCHLAVFQNCFNEVSDKLESVIRNIKKVCQTMPAGAVILLIDRGGYTATDNMLADLKSWAEAGDTVKPMGEANLSRRAFDCRPLLETVPEIIRKNLYRQGRDKRLFVDDGLIFSNDVNFLSLVLQRCANVD